MVHQHDVPKRKNVQTGKGQRDVRGGEGNGVWCGKTDRGRASQSDASGCDLPTADVTATRVGGRQGNHKDNDEGAERPAVAELFFASFFFF